MQSRARCASLLRQCSASRDLLKGEQVRGWIAQAGCLQDTLLGNLLVEMYGKCGRLDHACSVFQGIANRNVFSWAIMAAAFAQNGHHTQAILCLREMQLEGVKPDKFCFTTALASCTDSGQIEAGIAIQAHISEAGLESDVVVGTALMNMHGKCGWIEDAVYIFQKLCSKNIVSWTAMAAAFAQRGDYICTLDLLKRMDLDGVKPTEITYALLLDACACLGDLAKGRYLHNRVRSDGFSSQIVVTALMNMYSKCRRIEEARLLFDESGKNNLVAWTVMIAVYAQNGHCTEAVTLFRKLDLEGIDQDLVSFVGILEACIGISSLGFGQSIHARIVAAGFRINIVVGTALINMYSKSGALDLARKTFNLMLEKNIICWNTMIAAYAQHGDFNQALMLMSKLQQEGYKPNQITFTCCIAACSHGGLVDDAVYHFSSMVHEYRLVPSSENYGCMVDLVGRAGRLDEAERFIQGFVPIADRAVQWKALLAACKIQGDLKTGRRIAERLLELDPRSDAPYVLLANIYGDSSMHAAEGDELMR